MNKTTIFLGIGILALSGFAYWYFSKPSDSSAASNGQKSLSNDTSTDTSTDESVGSGLGIETGGKSRKQTRRDCKAEAKAQGLHHLSRKRRQFMRDCKAAGGVNADTADFAFNGFDGAFE